MYTFPRAAVHVQKLKQLQSDFLCRRCTPRSLEVLCKCCVILMKQLATVSENYIKVWWISNVNPRGLLCVYVFCSVTRCWRLMFCNVRSWVQLLKFGLSFTEYNDILELYFFAIYFFIFELQKNSLLQVFAFGPVWVLKFISF